MIRAAGWAVFLCCLTLTATAIEWDASRYSIGAYSGYAKPASDTATAGLNFTLSGNLTVPLLVEQHLVMTPSVFFQYQPMVAPIEIGFVGGNFLSAGFALLIEHDIALGSKKGWYGTGPQLSLNGTAGQYRWVNGVSELDAVKVENSFGISADLVIRAGLELNTRYAVWMKGQFTPMEDGYSGISIGATYTF